MLTDVLESCELLLDYCDVFNQLFGLAFTAGDPLVNSDIMLHFSKSVSMKKQTHLHFGWPEGCNN